MENNRELNEMIFQNYGELYDAMLNYLRENCLITHFPIQGDRYDEQSNKLLLVGRSLNGGRRVIEERSLLDQQTGTVCHLKMKCIRTGLPEVCKTQIWIYRGKPDQTPL